MLGTIPEAPAARAPRTDPALSVGRIVTALLVAGPVLGFACLLPFISGHLLNMSDVVIAVALYVVTGFGISVGFHRLLTHRSFKPNRALKIVCAVAGSMALEGSAISWVAIHRRHHMFGDQPGDPHSPHGFGPGTVGTLKGFVWAHTGWLFAMDPTDTKRFAPDLHRDRDLVVIDRLFPLLAVASLALPFFIGWALFGTLFGALSAFLWAGLVRMAVLHHVTWSINSVCHLWGRRPFATHDHSTNVGVLGLLSFGESFHNFHHASPSSARHGVLPHQHDLSARLISFFEGMGWATKVRWPNPVQIVALLQPGPVEEPMATRSVGSLRDTTLGKLEETSGRA
ncbi:MAG TPA: acyl-CoA desaturase [Candidatus Acidoferrum sp.]|nr:acyl-CoA desaturase [Candidatus Acidoferrum sp.]